MTWSKEGAAERKGGLLGYKVIPPLIFLAFQSDHTHSYLVIYKCMIFHVPCIFKREGCCLMITIPALESWRQENPWGPLVSQSVLSVDM